MTWLHVPPGTVPPPSSPSAPGSADSNSDCSLLSDISAGLCAGSVTWKGKLLPLPLWSRRWRRGGFIRLLSGLTLEPLTAQRGVDAWISSLRETRARGTASRESAAASSMTDGCSTAPLTYSRPAGLILSSAKTCRGTRADSSPLLSRHWSDWAAALRREYSARPKPAIPCDVSDCSSWPSAKVASGGWERDRNGNVYPTLEGVAADWRSPSDVSKRGGSQPAAKRKAGGHTINLEDQAEHWMAPQVPNGGRSTTHAEQIGASMYHNGKKVQLGLESQAKAWSSPKASDPEKAGPNMRGSKGDVPLPGQAANWPGPAARDWKGPNAPVHLEVSSGSLHLDQLPNFVEHVFRPPSSPARPTIAGGSMSSTDGPNSNQPSAKRKLNPIFVEALMRWPTGLSGFERRETAWTRWRQLQRSFLSALFSPPPGQTDRLL